VSKWDCFDFGGSWVNSKYNFDNILEAMVTLYVISSTEGWIDIMWSGVDSIGINLNPKEGANLGWATFFILFVIIGSFFIMNLFAGVVVDSFVREKEKIGGLYFLT
jgi:hypothetical protein